jgi:hypothetical protein
MLIWTIRQNKNFGAIYFLNILTLFFVQKKLLDKSSIVYQLFPLLFSNVQNCGERFANPKQLQEASISKIINRKNYCNT